MTLEDDNGVKVEGIVNKPDIIGIVREAILTDSFVVINEMLKKIEITNEAKILVNNDKAIS